MSKPELISFETCPFVQRSVITLLEKGIEFDITYIDLENKPDWFLKISPFGKVPVLKVDDKVVFESAVINEYLDEVNPPSMHPSDPLEKALNRAWIEFSSGLNMSMFFWAMAKNQDDHDRHFEKMMSDLKKVEAQLNATPFFNGGSFCIIDAAFAPFFMRLEFIADALGTHYLEKTPKLLAWHQALMAKESVQKSVVSDIKEKFVTYITDRDTVVGNAILAK
jgi:glutathione S-transferase